ncbi:MAG: helix-turn-helix domain-containing protein [Acholeplasmatales bacterium]|jgi:transcriptional regulator with XRE-family HTH domain|nr:helix-turn-helix domain-containing protein [Acholeplasmatales bacterium]
MYVRIDIILDKIANRNVEKKTDSSNRFGSIIREERKKQGKTLKEVTGNSLSQSLLSKAERGITVLSKKHETYIKDSLGIHFDDFNDLHSVRYIFEKIIKALLLKEEYKENNNNKNSQVDYIFSLLNIGESLIRKEYNGLCSNIDNLIPSIKMMSDTETLYFGCILSYYLYLSELYFDAFRILNALTNILVTDEIYNIFQKYYLLLCSIKISKISYIILHKNETLDLLFNNNLMALIKDIKYLEALYLVQSATSSDYEEEIGIIKIIDSNQFNFLKIFRNFLTGSFFNAYTETRIIYNKSKELLVLHLLLLNGLEKKKELLDLLSCNKFSYGESTSFLCDYLLKKCGDELNNYSNYINYIKNIDISQIQTAFLLRFLRSDIVARLNREHYYKESVMIIQRIDSFLKRISYF